MREKQECRICLADDDVSNLINPCKCIGSIRYVHNACLSKWVITSSQLCCVLCYYQFETDNGKFLQFLQFFYQFLFHCELILLLTWILFWPLRRYLEINFHMHIHIFWLHEIVKSLEIACCLLINNQKRHLHFMNYKKL
jgi:hypothetical protein